MSNRSMYLSPLSIPGKGGVASDTAGARRPTSMSSLNSTQPSLSAGLSAVSDLTLDDAAAALADRGLANSGGAHDADAKDDDDDMRSDVAMTGVGPKHASASTAASLLVAPHPHPHAHPHPSLYAHLDPPPAIKIEQYLADTQQPFALGCFVPAVSPAVPTAASLGSGFGFGAASAFGSDLRLGESAGGAASFGADDQSHILEFLLDAGRGFNPNATTNSNSNFMNMMLADMSEQSMSVSAPGLSNSPHSFAPINLATLSLSPPLQHHRRSSFSAENSASPPGSAEIMPVFPSFNFFPVSGSSGVATTTTSPTTLAMPFSIPAIRLTSEPDNDNDSSAIISNSNLGNDNFVRRSGSLHQPSSNPTSRRPSRQNSASSIASVASSSSSTKSLKRLSQNPIRCANCKTTHTSVWRRNLEGRTVCNSCGLYERIHGKPRPAEMHSSVVIRRERKKFLNPADAAAANDVAPSDTINRDGADDQI
ncbi:Transcription factor GATA-6 [Physocladia obscura]|uniref:Transcription factor GATA-6 n=1 Tax=Physocladia obscura TaxID=109957 RepID=A0AAD5T551_9FUNG|nr:Transcription factor GATA-6 [Physocladia obscura]